MKTTLSRRIAPWLPALVFLSFYHLHAQQWQRVGDLPAGQISVLLVKGDTLFAAGPNELYYSGNGGDTWDTTATTIPVAVHQSGWVQVLVLDANGALIRTIWNDEIHAGAYEFVWDAGDLPPGTYFCRLTTPNGVATRPMVLLK